MARNRNMARKPKSRTRVALVRVLGVVVVLVLIEFGTRGCVDWVGSRSIKTNTVGVRDVSIEAGDAPTAWYYGILGYVSNGSIALHDLTATPVNVAKLTVSADRLNISRWSMMSGKARITGTPPYRVSAYLSPRNLGDYLNATVRFQAGYLSATIEGHNMDVKPKLVARNIVISDGHNSFRVPLPGRDILPCTPENIGVGYGIVASCESRRLPPVLAKATD